MKKRLIAAFAGALALVPLIASATLIDLGPRNNRVFGGQLLPWDSGIGSLVGQTISYDIRFTNDEFIQIFHNTSKTFTFLPWLNIQGIGWIPDVEASAYTVDAKGNRNSWIETSGEGDFGGVLSDDLTPFHYSLGIMLPMVDDKSGHTRGDVDSLDVYGIHYEIKLPDADFEVLGAELFISTSGVHRWENFYAVGPHVPDTGTTACLLGLSLAAMAGFKKFR